MVYRRESSLDQQMLLITWSTFSMYISLNSPIYAKRMVDMITRRTMQISDQSYSGRKVPEYQAEDVCELIE